MQSRPTGLTSLCPLQTTYKGKSSFQTYSDYLRWESFLRQQLQTFPEGSALHRGFQTCEHWKQIFMEIIGGCEPAPPPGQMVGNHTEAATLTESTAWSLWAALLLPRVLAWNLSQWPCWGHW